MKKILKCDLHGFSQLDALNRVEKLLFSNWRESDEVELEIITGHGTIRQEVIKLLDSYNFIWHHFPLTNKGCIRVIG